MTLTRQPVVHHHLPFERERTSRIGALINGPVRSRICVGKTLPEKLEHPLGGIARPRALPFRNRGRYYHYNRAPMRWSAVLSHQMPNFQPESVHRRFVVLYHFFFLFKEQREESIYTSNNKWIFTIHASIRFSMITIGKGAEWNFEATRRSTSARKSGGKWVHTSGFKRDRSTALANPSKTKIITHPLHDSRIRLQTNSVIEIEDSSARRTCSEFVRPRAVCLPACHPA